MTDEEELWICHYKAAKKTFNVDKLWCKIKEQILTKLDVYLENSWLNYLLKLLEVDETTEVSTEIVLACFQSLHRFEES